MDNLSLIFSSYVDDETAFPEHIPSSPDLIFSLRLKLIVVIIMYFLMFLTCMAGIAGNGVVIWLLGFRLKRNPFTTYVLNLAVADIGILISSIVGHIISIILRFSGAVHPLGLTVYANIYATIYSLMYITDQLLLTTISIDRCMAVLFPIWHRCHRPPHFSRIVCILLWVLSFLICGLDFLLMFANQFILLQFIVNVAICTPLMSISTIILFVKICTKPQQRKQGKLLTAISLALFFFLTFGFPMNYCYFVFHYYFLDAIDVKLQLSSGSIDSELDSMKFLMLFFVANIIPLMAAFMCTILNCSINPLIYFLVGRKKEGRSRLSMKVALQRVFVDVENCRGQDGPIAETQF